MPIRLVLSLVCVLQIGDATDLTKVREAKSARSYALAASLAGKQVISVDPLAGIPAVIVSTSRSGHLKETWISRTDLTSLIERGLREHQVPLAPADEKRDEPRNHAVLSGEVRVVEHGKLSAYDVTLVLRETLLRQLDRDTLIHAPIWRCQELGIVKTADLKVEIVNAVRAAVADFSKAFKTAH
jgi:hypothetical protein